MGTAPISQAKCDQRFGDTEATSDKSAGALIQNPEFFFQRRRPWKAVAAVREPRLTKLGQQAY
jgi:hypothetical protein